MSIDKTVHEPTRLRMMMILTGIQETDFNFLRLSLGLTKGNLSRHIDRLETAEYITVKKTFKGKRANTRCRITKKGAKALAEYWKQLDRIRKTKGME